MSGSSSSVGIGVTDLEMDSLIVRLLEMRTSHRIKFIQMSEAEVRGVVVRASQVFLRQPMLLEVEAPLKVCGDIHGQFTDLLRLFETGGYPPTSRYLFLGDYVDRGRNSLEVIMLLLCYKVRFPTQFYLLRGNHECASINKDYGFLAECKKRYTVKIWEMFNTLFNLLPVAAIIEDKIFCCHGGLSPHLDSMEQIRSIARPASVPIEGLLCDLLWADPDPSVAGWADNPSRGVSYVFGEDEVVKFLKKFNLDLVCRAHQMVDNGYAFFANRQLVTLFSAPNYCGELDNTAAFMNVDETLMCTFRLIEPAWRVKTPQGGPQQQPPQQQQPNNNRQQQQNPFSGLFTKGP